MTIKRQYSLPYCTLTLEGMSSDVTALGKLEQRPLLSILLNAECRFSHTAQFLKGDRTFFTSLVQAVGRYAQEFLSGIRHPQLDKDEPEMVQLTATEDRNIHRLTWYPTPESTESTGNGATATNNYDKLMAISLTTVQLFDLVDAVDQFLADTRTLPELSVPLQPVSKRYRQAEVPASERVLPPAIGIGSLALAAALFALIPVPEVTEPEIANQESQLEEVTPEAESTESPEEPPVSEVPESSTDDGETENSSTDTEDTAQDELTLASDAENPDSRENEEETESLENQQSSNSRTQEGEDSTEDQQEEQTPSNSRSAALSSRNRNGENSTSPRTSANTSSNTNTRSRQASASPEEIRAALASATEITEPNELYYIQKYVRNRILDNWDNAGDLSRDLEYRVSVARDGTILDYEPINGTSSRSNSLTPLPDLSYRSTDGSGIIQEEIAKLRVVFTENGVVEISPWRGFTSQPNFASDITDREKLDELGNTLRRSIHQEWDGDVSYSRGLKYRVAVTEDGRIADYSFLNSAAASNLGETPLERLLEPEAAGIGTRESNSVVPQAPLAHFQVVFKPNGVLEIAPW